MLSSLASPLPPSLPGSALTALEIARTFYIGLFIISESNGAMPTSIDDDQLTDTFAALANSTRRAILARPAEGAATVNELAEPFAMTLPAVSKHIKVLERAGLVVRGQSAQ